MGTNPRLLVPLSLLVACSAPDSTTRHTVTDSAGIRIVESTLPAWDGDGWRIEADPVLDIGVREGDDAYLFDQIIDLRLLEDGGVAVANMGDNSLRVFGADGRLRWRAGRTGEGPGEYGQIWRVRTPPGGGILAVQSNDIWQDYLYDSEGNLIRSIDKTEVLPGEPVFMAGLFDDGSYIYASWPQGRPVKGDVWLDSATLYMRSSDGPGLDTVVSLPAMRFARVDERRGDGIDFGPSLAMAAGDTTFLTAFTETWQIDVRDRSGRTIRRIRRAFTPRPVTDEDIARYRRDYLDRPNEAGRQIPQAERARRERLLATRQFAETFPAHGRMLIDRESNLWVERDAIRPGGSAGFNPVYTEPTDWEVFDARGVWLGSVVTPPRFRVMDVDARFVAGIWRDEVDVEHVRVYRLNKRR